MLNIIIRPENQTLQIVCYAALRICCTLLTTTGTELDVLIRSAMVAPQPKFTAEAKSKQSICCMLTHRGFIACYVAGSDTLLAAAYRGLEPHPPSFGNPSSSLI